MKTRNTFTKLSLAMTVIAIVLLVSSRSAAANRTWVAPSGDDNNSCSNANPCKTFTGALAKTNAGGEIVVKESGGFGPVTINKSVTIDAGGKYAGIQTSSSGPSYGVVIQTGNTDVVVLRGLTIKELGVGEVGIAAAFGVLRVENCALSDFTAFGIYVSAALTLFVQDTVISDCGLDAIIMAGGGSATIEHSRLVNSGDGISLSAGGQITVRSTVASGNRSGFSTFGGTLNLENCVISNNDTGVTAELDSGSGPTIVVISNSLVTNNQTGLLQTCVNAGCSAGTSVIYSRGNNTVTGNKTDVSGTITPLGGS
jgi:hypothetical protein